MTELQIIYTNLINQINNCSMIPEMKATYLHMVENAYWSQSLSDAEKLRKFNIAIAGIEQYLESVEFNDLFVQLRDTISTTITEITTGILDTGTGLIDTGKKIIDKTFEGINNIGETLLNTTRIAKFLPFILIGLAVFIIIYVVFMSKGRLKRVIT